ncbi:MAG: enterochelin esterase-like enzyme, partial [Acidobacteria bacterium]|nr:enterochelin esterase-like enzyme [Acidobacteriota bacterium]
VKRIKFQSAILSKWWGQPIYLGATVLLPKGYDTHPNVRYPVNYIQDHFSLDAPSGFGRGGELDRLWMADTTPRFLAVTLQHPSPYYDDSYGVDSDR